MTYGDRLPWGCLRWSVFLHDGEREVALTREEFELVCAAVEYDRCQSLAEVARAKERAEVGKGSYRLRLWRALMDGANGLRFVDSEASMLLCDVFERLGCRVEWRYPHSPDPNVARARAMLDTLRAS